MKEFRMKKIILVTGLLSVIGIVNAAEINIVAAENFYGQLAKEIGGKNVKVNSIMSNPDADPHLFTTSPSTSKAISNAQIIIYNGADYDDWMKPILATVDTKKVIVINVADLVGVKSGANPHLWYRPQTFPTLANVLADKLKQLSPSEQKEVSKNLQEFLGDNAKVQTLINQNKQKYAGTPVTATEPVFGYMSEALGLKMYGEDFQWKIMNDTEPTPKMIASFQELFTKKTVKVLFYNSQVSDSLTENMKALAKKNQVQVVGVTETMPVNTKINQWLTNEVNTTVKALSVSKK